MLKLTRTQISETRSAIHSIKRELDYLVTDLTDSQTRDGSTIVTDIVTAIEALNHAYRDCNADSADIDVQEEA